MVSSQFQKSYRLFYANRKISELFLDVRVYRGSGICSDQFLILAKLVLKMATFNKKHCTKRNSYIIIKLDYLITKVYDNYSNKFSKETTTGSRKKQ